MTGKPAGSPQITRRAVCGGIALGAAVAALPGRALASEGERRILLHNLHTGERLDIAYWASGRYVKEALGEINHALRDHYNGQVRHMDLELLDLLYVMREQLGSRHPFEVISAYRSRKTNEMLRKRDSKVGKNSMHVHGMAIDIRVPDRELKDVRRVAKDLKRGGVGYYPRAKFVHVDVGPIRYW